MSRSAKSTELRLKGMGLKARFVSAMTIALSIVMLATLYVIYASVTHINDVRMNDAFAEAARFTRDVPPFETEPLAYRHETGVRIQDVTYGDGKKATLYTFGGADDPLGIQNIFVPHTDDGHMTLLRLLFAIMAVVVLVGALVALWVAGQVSNPVIELIEDVRQIARGRLDKKARSRGEGEIELLARAIDRMVEDLRSAQDAALELSIRQREREVAGGVREALLPLTTPMVQGYDVGAAFFAGPDFGGDFHDFIEREDGRLGLLVCGVSGNGIPAALVGATARSYLRAELERTDDLKESLSRVNGWLHADVRRGMYVSALYALLDPLLGTARIVCAGHRVPLLRYEASTEQIRVVHPEGIALGFDKGPVFDRRLQLVETPLEPGDRFVLCNAGPVEVLNDDGQELGEKALYKRIKKHAALETPAFLKNLRRDLEAFAGDDGLDRDVVLLTIRRET